MRGSTPHDGILENTDLSIKEIAARCGFEKWRRSATAVHSPPADRTSRISPPAISLLGGPTLIAGRGHLSEPAEVRVTWQYATGSHRKHRLSSSPFPCGASDNDVAIAHPCTGADCWMGLGSVGARNRCVHRRLRQHPAGLEQVRNRADTRDRSRAEENT